MWACDLPKRLELEGPGEVERRGGFWRRLREVPGAPLAGWRVELLRPNMVVVGGW